MNLLCFDGMTVELNEVERVFWTFQNWMRVIVIEYKNSKQKILFQSRRPIAALAMQLNDLVHCSFRTFEHINAMADALKTAKSQA